MSERQPNRISVRPLALSITQAAEASSLSPYTIRNLIRRGELKTTRIGTRHVIPIKALERLVEDGAPSRTS